MPLWGAIALLVGAALAHGLARFFHGQGTFRQLVYCWGVLQLPFVLVAILVLNIPSIFRYTPGTPVATAAIVFMFAKLAVAAAVVLYLVYAQVVAFGAVERFSFWKGLGVLALLSILLGLIGACLSTGSRQLLQSAYSY